MTEAAREPNPRLALYDRVRPSIKTGDVIAFSGKGAVSDFIKRWTQGDVSHVGIVLDVTLPGELGDSVLLCESTTLVNCPDAVRRELVKGVQITWLSQRLDMYDGAAWLYALRAPLTPAELAPMQDWLRERHAARVPYDYVQAIGAGVDVFDRLGLENEPDFSRLFCSELASRALQLASRVPAVVNPSEVLPLELVEGSERWPQLAELFAPSVLIRDGD